MKHFRNPSEQKKILSRLRKVEGQVSAICRMVEDQKYCVDILLQISAVQGALGKASQLLLGSHVETCVAAAFKSGSKKDRQTSIDELMQVFARYGGLRGR